MLNLRQITKTKFPRFWLIRHESSLVGTSGSLDEIKIPKRIPREPTDILRALESTISRDPTAAHYKYHDDPFLIPLSNMGKRTFAMAQEAGRKAAHFIRKEHADLFQHREAEPYIDAFAPPMIYTEKSQVSVTDLIKLIKTAQATDARLVYGLLEKNSPKEITTEIKVNLMEMICYQNNTDSISEEFIEERWFKQGGNKGKEKLRKTWKDGDFAEELFIGLESPGETAYCAIIQGMAKYLQVDKAFQLFNEALDEKNLILNTNTFNSIISVVDFLKEDYDMRWTLVQELLTKMHANKLKPNLGTLNSCLQSLSTMKGSRIAKENALKTLAEFKSLGIEPSLASWGYVIKIFYNDRGPISNIFYDILDQVEQKNHTIQDLRDTNFFVTAMEICRFALKDSSAARRLHEEVLLFGNNYDLIGDSYKESVYYRHYFALSCSTLPLEEFMSQIYDKLVPHIYVPEPLILEEVLRQIDANCAAEYLPKMWSDIIIFDHTFRDNLVELVLKIMVYNKPEQSSDLNEKFAVVAWDIHNRIENQHENKMKKLLLTGDQLGCVLLLLLRNDDFEKAWEIMQFLNKNQNSVLGVPQLEAFQLFLDKCVEHKTPSRGITAIQYCSDCGFPEVVDLARGLVEKLTLDENYKTQLEKAVGHIPAPSPAKSN